MTSRPIWFSLLCEWVLSKLVVVLIYCQAYWVLTPQHHHLDLSCRVKRCPTRPSSLQITLIESSSLRERASITHLIHLIPTRNIASKFTCFPFQWLPFILYFLIFFSFFNGCHLFLWAVLGSDIGRKKQFEHQCCILVYDKTCETYTTTFCWHFVHLLYMIVIALFKKT